MCAASCTETGGSGGEALFLPIGYQRALTKPSRPQQQAGTDSPAGTLQPLLTHPSVCGVGYNVVQ